MARVKSEILPRVEKMISDTLHVVKSLECDLKDTTMRESLQSLEDKAGKHVFCTSCIKT